MILRHQTFKIQFIVFLASFLCSFSLIAQNTNILNTNINYKMVVTSLYYSGIGDWTSEGEVVYKFNYYDYLTKKSTNTCWHEVKSPNEDGPWEYSPFFVIAEGNNAHYDTEFGLELEAMEDDDGDRCNYNPDSDQDHQVLQARFKDYYDKRKYTRGDIPGEYLYIGDYTYSYMFGDRDGSLWNAIARTAYRYTGGNTCAAPLKFGNVISGLTYNHSNALTASTGDPDLDYSASNIGVSVYNDIVYSFELDYAADVKFSLKSNTANTEVLFSLVEHDEDVIDCNYSDYIVEGATTVSGILNKTERLCAGLYYVVIDGKKGKKGNFTLDITPTKIADELTINISNLHDATCNGGDGTVNVNISGGKTDIYYRLTPGGTSNYYPVTGFNFYYALEANTYTVFVRDALDCSVSKTITIGEPDEITTTEEITQAISCFGDSDGSLLITPSGGSGQGYTLNFDGSSSSFNIDNLKATTYNYTVYDSEDCSVEKSVEITQPDPIAIDGSSDNGDINVAVSGGNNFYQYLWSNGADTKDLSGLSNGVYTLSVEDFKGCTGEKEFEVTNVISNLDEINGETFSFYPSPAQNFITIAFEKDGEYLYKISDLSGAIVKEGDLINSNKISLEGLNSVAYFITVFNDFESVTKKLIIY